MGFGLLSSLRSITSRVMTPHIIVPRTASSKRIMWSTLEAERSRRSGGNRESSLHTNSMAHRVSPIWRREHRELFVGLQEAKGVATATTPNGFNSLHSSG